ncbi:phenylacetic acid degradation bifunctional protein PaaZ [Mycobacterium sp. CBMA293]|uniref:phenylacetic acid degradation bifunctional protein PaaZ n=1 Tax=unclassified Mycolicibacterium TaxID=2636767 RepID=UPI0012DE45DB|nr:MULTISPECIES: phenylacetic acid degradation bifunctional protein PaaZ [unclassified Mycolicibacterium]MUL47170.1 phenylacetic acid degradation bifunctional protein PaaZ [Mycolicibacterium sp. CBMA 360]MUL61279.1 phenylacetic acid degradation bifunctional protein PaaZ [Mycolicibacterium sp. CBMA 335]MUL72014.1 phenylacetic acid degradation bifunctional protein PaaZ [Mycolicibacterium sp. CBMA 311]MUL96181.1 phenylacetic acid degradation bifunctional protein PaaZ [Mycolicibacterium sp. CBMA 23
MSALLQSYAAGTWFRADDEGEPVRDAVTGEEIARVSSRGIDYTAMVEHARSVGGPAVQALTFHQRAGLLKALAKHLGGFKDEFYALSFKTGATQRDSAIDIDGGIGTLFSFASKGTRELPNDTIILDGALEQLGKQGSFIGQHIYTSRPGVAVQINAFNFPVWGMLEKLAPAFLAGLPSIVKPASQTAYLTEAVVRRIIESAILPEGSLQLICGSAGTLLDALTEQDSVAFTGSARTAAILRSHPAVVHGGVQLGVEADSLNAVILGPDVAVSDPEFELFVKGVVAEMTAKAGQKCTAIRRVIVPESTADAAIEAISARLAKITVGNPSNETVRMGSLVSLEQRQDVLKAVETLRNSSDIVFGDIETVQVVDAEAERGAFLSPILLRARPGAAEPHDVEPFGPVSTVLTYATIDEAVALAARGRGSLVASLVSHDPTVVRKVALGLAPWHGRLLVLDRDDAAESTGHGSPLPTLIHGGPGRAGGGEELGGVRAVLHHMQRTAIQGSPDALTAITGQWMTGASRSEGDVHPFRKSLAELRVGDSITSKPRRVTLADIGHFAEFTGDTFYAHTDAEAAAANPLFGGIVAHGYLVVSLAAGLFVEPNPGPVLANFGVDNLRFLTPVKADDTIAVTLTVKQITPRISADYGEVRWDAVVVNQDGAAVATYDVLTLVAKTWPQGGEN